MLPSLLLALLLPSIALADIPSVYHSENDDGVPAVSPVEIQPGASTTLHLYIDGGSVASTASICSAGTGDEICAYDLDLAGTAGLTLSSFTPAPGVDHYMTSTAIGIVGGDPWRGHLGPLKIGDLDVQGPTAATLELLPSQSVDSAMAIAPIPQETLVFVPEPHALAGLISGVLLLFLLNARRQKPRVSGSAMLVLGASLSLFAAPPARAQVSTDCGDVVSDGVIDTADLDALRQFLAGNPGAPDLQGDPQGLARCDVGGNGLCEIDDYARIRRYMLDLPGGLNETCPLAGSTFPPVVLPGPTVDQASTISTDRASVVLSGTAAPYDLVRVTGGWGRPATTTGPEGTWELEVPLVFDSLNTLDVFVDYGAGYQSPPASLNVTQTDPAGESTIEGRAVDTADGSGIADVTVTVGTATTTTDPFGRFEIGGLPEGRVVVRLEHPQYVPEAFRKYTGALRWGGDAPDGAFLSPALGVFGMTQRVAGVMVGSGGGTITTPAGIELVVPAGALAGSTEISVTEVPYSPSGGYAAVDIGPGAIAFDPPAILRIPTPLAPGMKVDLAQVDQGAGLESPGIGVVDATGRVEVEIHSTNGDKYYIEYRSWFAAHSPRDVGLIREVPVDNCEGAATFGRISQKSIDFELIEAPGWAPFAQQFNLDLADLEDWSLEDWDGLQKLPSHHVPLAVVTPPGSVSIVEITYDSWTVSQQTYGRRYPDDGSPPTAYLGELRFTYIIPTSFRVVSTSSHACTCGWGGSGGSPQEEDEISMFASSPPSAPAGAASSSADSCQGGSWGDPHMIRFDHAGEAIPGSRGDGRYDFQASGEFVLFESTVDGMVVQVRLEPSNNSTTVGTAAAMDVDGDRVSVHGGQAVLEVRIEGIPTPLTVGVPVPLPGGGELERGTTSFGTDSLTVRWTDSSEILIRGWHSQFFVSFFPALAPGRSARVQGLLGNANGILIDDLNLRDGTPADPATLHTTYADSWRISAAESLFDYEPGEDTSTYNGTPTDPDYTVDDLDPVARAAAEIACMAAGIVDDPLFTECVIDTAVLGTDATDAASDALALVPNEGTYYAVPGDANVFAAGLASVPDLGGGGGNGSLPVEITLPAGTERRMRVLDAAGTIDVSATETSIPPDGLASSPIEWGTWGGLAGPNVSRKGITMGVFLEATAPPATTPGPYVCGDASGQFVYPEIGQIFCLGDGLSAFDEPQFVAIPDAATRLFLGHAERVFVAPLDLADIVGGGDGTGTGSLQGINILDGSTESSHAGALSAATNTFVPSGNSFVDGIFVPDGGSGPVPISSTGLTVTGISDSLGNNGQSITHAWDHIWNGHANGITSTLTGSILGVATNKGITFDLDAIEAAYPGAEVVAAPLTAAMGSTTQATSATDYYVFVDGIPRGAASLSGAIDGPDTTRDLGVSSLSSDSRFLTLITSSDGWTNWDWAFWLDPTLELGTDGLPPGQFGDNSGAHEFILLFSP